MMIILFAVCALALLYCVFAAANGKKEALALLFGPVERQSVNFETLELKDSPNQFLVCPPDLCRQAKPHLESPVFELSVDELRQRWMERIASQPRVSELSSDGDQYDFEQLTPLIGFPDTVTVRFLPAGEGRSTLAIYSRSHYGHSDLGANKKRIRAWLELLTTPQA